jgi:hypothetical protein
MSLSLYEISIPVFIRAFGNLSRILDKAKAFADEKGLPHEALLNARLIDDMYPLTAQVQRASDTSRFVPVRVGLYEAVSMADTESSFDELQARIKATVDYLRTVPADAFDGRETAEVEFKAGPRTFNFSSRDYVTGFALPNFYFHITTAYAILRHKGVPLGKYDFFGVS